MAHGMGGVVVGEALYIHGASFPFLFTGKLSGRSHINWVRFKDNPYNLLPIIPP